MQDVQSSIDVSFDDLSLEEWKQAIEDLAEDLGTFQPLGDSHFAALIDAGKTLLVTFECAQDIRARSPKSRPLGLELVRTKGWSHLGVYSDDQSWFRDGRIYGYFDRLIDDGFFEDFDRVLFYGTGACGYAAAAYSVAAPGSVVLTVQPHATMDPRMTEWDPRYPEAHRLDFTDRFGYAPDMLDAADQAFVLYDPRDDLDAMHATLFERPNVTRLRMPNMGDDLPARLAEMDMLFPIIEQAGEDRLTELSFARLHRARRDNIPYLRALTARLDAEDRKYLNYLLCRTVISQRRAPHFRRRLRELHKHAVDGDFRPPPAAT